MGEMGNLFLFSHLTHFAKRHFAKGQGEVAGWLQGRALCLAQGLHGRVLCGPSPRSAVLATPPLALALRAGGFFTPGRISFCDARRRTDPLESQRPRTILQL